MRNSFKATSVDEPHFSKYMYVKSDLFAIAPSIPMRATWPIMAVDRQGVCVHACVYVIVKVQEAQSHTSTVYVQFSPFGKFV